MEFGVKFPACFKKLYKLILLGEFGLKKENLPNRGKKYKTKVKHNNRVKLTNFKSIWDIENKVSNVGWFEINAVVGKYRKSGNLFLVEQSSKNYFVMKLKNNTANEVLEKFKDIAKNNNLIRKIKGIITDRGK